jgi:hypothetical protein
MAIVYLFLQTALFVSVWTLVHRHVAKHGPIAAARGAVRFNSWFYALASAALLVLILTPKFQHVASHLYHASKFYEYVDIIGVRASGGDIDLHFAVHHLTTPYLTYARVLHNSQGWQLVAALNALHHVLMYAYFGGAGFLRPALPVTGTIQLLVGLGGEMWVSWEKSANMEPFLWPHGFVLGLLSIYLVLWIRDVREKAAQMRGGAKEMKRN